MPGCHLHTAGLANHRMIRVYQCQTRRLLSHPHTFLNFGLQLKACECMYIIKANYSTTCHSEAASNYSNAHQQKLPYSHTACQRLSRTPVEHGSGVKLLWLSSNNIQL